MLRYLYTILFIILIPAIMLRLYWRGRKNNEYRLRIKERFGFYHQTFSQHGIWLHAVSVGELMAARPLIDKILLENKAPLTVTTMTPTGSAQVKKIYGDAVQHVYIPYDYPNAINRFLKVFKPKFAIIMETEIWPNLFYVLDDKKIPFIIANARLAKKSFEQYQKIDFFFTPLLQKPTLIAAQSFDDAQHFKQLNVPDSHITIMGNLKYDIIPPMDLIAKAHELRSIWKKRPIWIAASTHTAEEDLIIKTAKALKKIYPNILCIIAPRHVERFHPLAEKCIAANFRIARRSQQDLIDDTTEMLLADTLGELFYFYALSDIALVCGSFAPIGGHNILEPAALGLPIIVGPQTFHFKTIVNDFLAQQALIQVDEQNLLPAMVDLLNNPSKAKQIGAHARRVVEANQGALDRLWKIIANHY